MSADWTPDPEVVATELGYIEQEQAHLPTCTLCGQRTNRPDSAGLCSKVDDAHVARRGGAR